MSNSGIDDIQIYVNGNPSLFVDYAGMVVTIISTLNMDIYLLVVCKMVEIHVLLRYLVLCRKYSYNLWKTTMTML